MKTPFYVFLLVLFSLNLKAQDIHPIDKQLTEWLAVDSNQNTTSMIILTDSAATLWDMEMNKYYKLLMKKLSNEERKALKTTQKNWLVYRDGELDFSYVLYGNMEGTMWRIVRADRRLEIIKKRALELKVYYSVFEEK